jgi:hypothetical protein
VIVAIFSRTRSNDAPDPRGVEERLLAQTLHLPDISSIRIAAEEASSGARTMA